MMSPLPSISKTYSLLQQDESQKEASSISENFSTDAVVFITPDHQIYHSTNTHPVFTEKENFEHHKSFTQRVNFDF